MGEQAVLVTFALSGDGLPSEEDRRRVSALERRLDAVLSESHLGELDGHEYGGGEVVIFLYGEDARLLFAAVEADLRAFDSPSGHAVVRSGGPDEAPPERVVVLTRQST